MTDITKNYKFIYIGFTPLHIACLEDSLEFVKKMLEMSGIEVDMTVSDGSTPLFVASRKGFMAIARELHSHGSDVNHPDYSGQTPMYIASTGGDIDTMEGLFELGADVDTPARSGYSHLIMAAAYGFLDAVKLLHEMGANMHAAGGVYNDTALIVAAFLGHDLIVEFLVDVGVDLDVAGYDGMTALDNAKAQGNVNIVEIFIIKKCSSMD